MNFIETPMNMLKPMDEKVKTRMPVVCAFANVTAWSTDSIKGYIFVNKLLMIDKLTLVRYLLRNFLVNGKIRFYEYRTGFSGKKQRLKELNFQFIE